MELDDIQILNNGIYCRISELPIIVFLFHFLIFFISTREVKIIEGKIEITISDKKIKGRLRNTVKAVHTHNIPSQLCLDNKLGSCSITHHGQLHSA